MVKYMVGLVFVCLFYLNGHAGVITEIQEEQVPIGSDIVINYPYVKLPNNPINMYIDFGTNSRFDIFFIDMKYDYDLVDWYSYKGWCIDRNKPMEKGYIYQVSLFNSYGMLPEKIRTINFYKINYIVNHKKGTKEDVQEAIWYIIHKSGNLSANAIEMVENANNYGNSYIPSSGELLVIICLVEGKLQPVIIEYPIPAEEIAFGAGGAEFPMISGGDVVPAGYFSAFSGWGIPLAAVGGIIGAIIYNNSGGDSDLPWTPPIIPPYNPPTPPNPPYPPTPVDEPSTLMYLITVGIPSILMLKEKLK